MQLLLCLLPGILLLGLPEIADALNCSSGNDVSVMVRANQIYDTCVAAAGDTCFEMRSKNWEIEPGYSMLEFGCGRCGPFDASMTECRECGTENCNTAFRDELKPISGEYSLCYLSYDDSGKVQPIAARCPKGEKCVSNRMPTDPKVVMVGCKGHCQKLGWKQCVECDGNLCNGVPEFSTLSLYLAIEREKSESIAVASDMADEGSSDASRPVAPVVAIAATVLLALGSRFC